MNPTEILEQLLKDVQEMNNKIKNVTKALEDVNEKLKQIRQRQEEPQIPPTLVP